MCSQQDALPPAAAVVAAPGDQRVGSEYAPGRIPCSQAAHRYAEASMAEGVAGILEDPRMIAASGPGRGQQWAMLSILGGCKVGSR